MKMAAIIDTGASRTLIKHKTYEELRKKVKNLKMVENNITLKSATGDVIKNHGTLSIDVGLAEKNFETEIIVVSNDVSFSTDVLIGIDFLRRNKAILNYESSNIILNNVVLPIFKIDSNFNVENGNFEINTSDNFELESERHILALAESKLTFIQNWTKGDLIRKQKEDEFCCDMVSHMKGIGKDELISENIHYIIKDELLCIIIKTPLKESICIYIPETCMNTAFRLCHEMGIAGHFDLERSIYKFKERFFAFKIRKVFKQLYEQCEVCHRNKRGSSFKAPIGKYPTVEAPFDRVHMDTTGPFQLCSSGNRYIVVFVDALTRYAEIKAVPNRKTETLAEALFEKIIQNHGAPLQLISDRGPEQTSALFNIICKHLGIINHHVAPYHSSSNGLAEATVKKTVDILRHLVPGKEDMTWDTYIPQVQISINTSYNSTIKLTPHYALYGTEKRLPFDIPIEIPQLSVNKESAILQRLEKQKMVRNEIKEVLGRSTDAFTERQHQKSKVKEITVGNIVYVKNIITAGAGNKLSDKFIGPYRVEELLPHNKLKVINLKNDRQREVHVDNVKLIPNTDAGVIHNSEQQQVVAKESIENSSDDSETSDNNESDSEEERRFYVVKAKTTNANVEPPKVRQLRSNSIAENLPWVQPKTIEFKKTIENNSQVNAIEVTDKFDAIDKLLYDLREL